MASVRIDSGELPSAEGVQEGHDLAQVIRHWQSVADGRFRDDCRFLLQMIDETDRLRLWEKNVGGFTYANRDEFLQKKVLIDYDLTERQTRQIVEALRSGKSGGIKELIAETPPAADPYSRPGNQNARKKDENAVANGNPVSPKTKGSHKSETIIARLKRDAATNPQAEALLGSIDAGDIKPYRAAVEMGWVKPPDPLATFLRYFSKQDRKARASIIQIILDCHGKD